MSAQTFRFANVEVRPDERQVLVDGHAVALRAKAYELLLALIERRDRVVSRAELYDTVWAGRVVEDNNLAVQMHALRKALGEHCVVTVPGRGYRFGMDQAGVAPNALAQASASTNLPPQVGLLGSSLPPLPPSTLMGRENDLVALNHRLQHDRLVSVVGAGGIGKTVLALAAAHEAEREPTGETVWIELAQILDPALLASTVARAFGLLVAGADPIRSLAIALAPVQALLILDNAEHLVDAVSRMASDVLAHASGIRMLVTSQVALRIEGERVFRLGSLAVPEPHTALVDAKTFGAVALFVEAAAAADRRFKLDESNVATVIDVCRRLDGLPLAIKLAAARLPFLGLQGMASRLNAQLELIGGGQRNAPTRQQTLRAALDWSHGLLSAQEQWVFRRLGVFVGGFTLPMAIAVVKDNAQDHALAGSQVVEVLAALVDRSLVDASDDDPPRLRLLESARAYSLTQLEAFGETNELRRRHARAFVDWMEREDEAASCFSEDDVVTSCENDIDNIRAALDWCTDHSPVDAVALVGSCFLPFVMLNLHGEWKRRCNSMAHLVTSDIPASIAARYWLGRARVHAGHEYPLMHRYACAAQALYRQVGDRRGLYVSLGWQLFSGRSSPEETNRILAEMEALETDDLPRSARTAGLNGRGRACLMARCHDDAARCFDEVMVLARDARDYRMSTTAASLRASVHYRVGEFHEGVRLMLQATASIKQLRHGSLPLAMAMLPLGLVISGQRSEARVALLEFFRHSRAADWWLFHVSEEAHALLAMQEGRHEAAARLLGYSMHKGRPAVDVPLAAEQTATMREELEAKLGTATLERLIGEGALLAPEAVCALTLNT